MKIQLSEKEIERLRREAHVITRRAPQTGHIYERVKCPICHVVLGSNWYIRHMRKYHPGQTKKGAE